MGNAQPESDSEAGFDLFDRWLAHRDQQSGDLGDAPAADAVQPLDSPLFAGTSADLGVPVDQLVPHPLVDPVEFTRVLRHYRPEQD